MSAAAHHHQEFHHMRTELAICGVRIVPGDYLVEIMRAKPARAAAGELIEAAALQSRLRKQPASHHAASSFSTGGVGPGTGSGKRARWMGRVGDGPASGACTLNS